MKIGVIGLGYWGPNIVRNLISHKNVAKVVCCDSNPKRLESIRLRYPSVETVTDHKAILKDPSVVAVAVVTPVSTHYKLAKEVLEAGKHVLIEKPMTDSVRTSEELISIADRKKLVLMVDHTFVYTGAVRKIKELIDKGEIGDILYFDSVRVNLGLFQHDINVIWDLAPHDISIMDYVIGKNAEYVSAIGAKHYNDIEDMAYLTVGFHNNVIAHFHVNWLSPVKVRRILIGGTKKMLVFDDMDPSEKVKVYDKGIDINEEESVYQTLVQYRTGDMYAPQIGQTEALGLMCGEFLSSILEGKKPLTDGCAGLKVVRILEASQKSLLDHNALIKLK
jgi:predicted dehydrogenase